MSPKSELYNELLTLNKESASGRVFVYVKDKERGIYSVSLTVKDGEIIDISDTQRRDGSPAEDFWGLPIANVTVIQASISDDVTKNPNVPDMRRLLDQIGEGSAAADGKATAAEQTTSQLWALSTEIDRIIAKKRLDRALTRGQIGLRAGVLMNFDESTPDDIGKINSIKMAAKELFGEEI